MKFGPVIAFLLGAAGLAAVIVYAGLSPIAQALLQVGPVGLAIVSALHLPVIAILGFAWWLVGDDMPGGTPWKFVWARLMRESVAEVLPFSQLGGIAIGVRTLTVLGLPAVPVGVSLLTDLIVELSAKLPYVLAGGALLLFVTPGSGILLPVVLGTGLILAMVIAGIALRNPLLSAVHRVTAGLVSRWPGLGSIPVDDLQRRLDYALTPGWHLLRAYGVHTFCWALGAAETWVIFHLMGAPVSALEAFLIDSLFSGLRTFGFAIPGAIGLQEGGYVLVCSLFGITPGTAVALALIRRAREFVSGVPALAVWQMVESRRARARRIMNIPGAQTTADTALPPAQPYQPE